MDYCSFFFYLIWKRKGWGKLHLNLLQRPKGQFETSFLILY